MATVAYTKEYKFASTWRSKTVSSSKRGREKSEGSIVSDVANKSSDQLYKRTYGPKVFNFLFLQSSRCMMAVVTFVKFPKNLVNGEKIFL